MRTKPSGRTWSRKRRMNSSAGSEEHERSQPAKSPGATPDGQVGGTRHHLAARCGDTSSTAERREGSARLSRARPDRRLRCALQFVPGDRRLPATLADQLPKPLVSPELFLVTLKVAAHIHQLAFSRRSRARISEPSPGGGIRTRTPFAGDFKSPASTVSPLRARLSHRSRNGCTRAVRRNGQGCDHPDQTRISATPAVIIATPATRTPVIASPKRKRP